MLSATQATVRPKIDIYEYLDFKDYLQDYYMAWKKMSNKVGYSWISAQLGLPNTRNFFQELVKGRRKLSDTYRDKIMELFRLTPEEGSYFEDLVNYNQAKNHKERKVFFEHVLKQKKTSKYIIDKDELEFFKNWEVIALYLMMDCTDVTDDLGAIKEHFIPELSLDKLKKAFKVLQKLGLIKKDVKGFWRLQSQKLTAEQRTREEAVKHFQADVLDLAKESIFKGPESDSIHRTISISASKQNLKIIRSKIEELNDIIISLDSLDKHKKNYAGILSINLTPLARVEE